MYEGASLTVLWKIASQITRLYKAHINLGPKDIQIALASVLYCDDTLLMMPGSADTTRSTLLGNQPGVLSVTTPACRPKPSQRHFALRFKASAEEINSNCIGREVNLNSKLGQLP